MIKIGNIEIAIPFILAPMAGVCDNAFRTICKEMGAGLVYTEMVSDKAVYYQNERTLKMLYVSDDERPVSLQVFGSDLESFTAAAKYIDKNSNCDIIDINMGCPVPKVATKAQAGAALLKDPEKVFEIVSEIVKIVSKPVTVKIRSGWDQESINAVTIAKVCEKAGASAIAIHGRTRSQMYRGVADLEIIKEVVEAVNIPVFANGDIRDVESAKKMFSYTKCAGLMIGRGAIGNPWIFQELKAWYLNEPYIQPKRQEVIEIILEHLRRLIVLKGERVACLEMRSHAHSYVKGMPNSSQIRLKINSLKTYDEYEKLFNS